MNYERGLKHMIQIVTSHNIEDLLKNPGNYVDDEEDVVLLKVFGKNAHNPTLLMVGLEAESTGGEIAEPWYIIEEDNDVSVYHHCSENKLYDTYERVLKKAMEEAEK